MRITGAGITVLQSGCTYNQPIISMHKAELSNWPHPSLNNKLTRDGSSSSFIHYETNADKANAHFHWEWSC